MITKFAELFLGDPEGQGLGAAAGATTGSCGGEMDCEEAHTITSASCASRCIAACRIRLAFTS